MTKTEANKLIKKFNKQFPVGSEVAWRSCSHDTATHGVYKTRSKAYLSNGGTPVVFLEGRAGYVSIEPCFLDYEYKQP